MLKNLLVPVTMVFLLSQNVLASKTASYCTSEENSNVINGLNVKTRFPIASVSKLYTTFWALSQLGENYKFKTKLHINDLKNGMHDIHIEGSRDPYFGKESLHYLISALNKLNITKIRNLTFDENFKFMWNVNSSKIMWEMDYTPDSPSKELVLNQLKNGKIHRSWLDGYEKTRQIALQRKKVELIQKPKLSISSISFLSKNEFNLNSSTSKFIFQSASLLQILKQMNKTSNNHAANQIFESLGGAAEFNKFIQNALTDSSEVINDSQILFLNGSGDNYRIVSGTDQYNEASCLANIKMLKKLKQRIDKGQLTSLQEIVAVVGGDSSYTDSTSTLNYLNNKHTDNSVVAKTGTVNRAITLGGMMSTNKGNVFFYFSEAIAGATARKIHNDQSVARAKIRHELNKLVNKYSGAKPFTYNESKFLSFDISHEVVESTSKTSRYFINKLGFGTDPDFIATEEDFNTFSESDSNISNLPENYESESGAKASWIDTSEENITLPDPDVTYPDDSLIQESN